jgi:hypothetical protein
MLFWANIFNYSKEDNMGGFKGVGSTRGASGEVWEALPGIQLVNRGVERLKENIKGGERGYSCKKVCSYIGFRVVSYALIPTALNLVSSLVCGLLTLLTLPTRCCGKKLNQWCWKHLQGSVRYLGQSLYDITCDVRQLTGKCCCRPESLYLKI